jgi:DNA-binding SARP family transcriptional activator
MVDAWLSRTLADDAVAREKLRGALLLARQGSRRYYLRYMECSMPPLFKLALEEGIDVELVQELVRLFRLKPPKDAPDNWPWPVTLRTLGKFTLSVDGEPVQFARKLPRKALLLLKALVAIGNREVPEQTLCDLLWSDEDGDAAVNALSITLVRLRKILGKSEAILHQGGKLLLNPELCWVDAWAFESSLGRDVDRKALDLYGGSFLPEDVGESWTVATRERLRGKFIHALSSHGAAMEQAGDLEVAVNCYLRGIDADAIVEEFHQGLMRCYQRLGRRSEAISAYRRMKQTLSVVLGVPPSEASQRLYRELLQGQIDAGNGMEFPADAESGGSITQLPVKRIGTRRRE